VEIQHLIGRTLRAVVALDRLGENTLFIDCDVLQADGGTRTAAITGAYVAVKDAAAAAIQKGIMSVDPVVGQVAAVSVGIIRGVPMLDLDYSEDSSADVDMNVAMLSNGRFVELQATGERNTFSRVELDSMLALATTGIRQLHRLQRDALAG
jgi:ribonuclease PH